MAGTWPWGDLGRGDSRLLPESVSEVSGIADCGPGWAGLGISVFFKLWVLPHQRAAISTE